jgi:SAM-dependent methyltransferase
MRSRLGAIRRRLRPPSPQVPDGGPTAAEAEADVRRAFLEVLGREVDQMGLAFYSKSLRAGMAVEELVATLEASEEHQLVQARRARQLPNLVAAHPDRYVTVTSDGGDAVPTFLAASPADFDWIEERIIGEGYYETPGIWTFGIDLDKRLMAEMIGMLAPASAVELGCSSGAVLHGLAEAGVDVCGIDISELAKSQATKLVRDRILIGDIATLEVGRRFDVAFGLDVFEHIHPGALDGFIAALVDLVRDGGHVVVNVPAFGDDEVFGEVFPMFLAPWRDDAAAGTPFRHLQVDEDGYPMHGHLVWATTDWWVARFERAGLRRLPAVERALLGTYGEHFDRATPARRSLYVFGKGVTDPETAALAASVAARRSALLEDLARQLADD